MTTKDYVAKYNFANGGINSFTADKKKQFLVDLENDFDLLITKNGGDTNLSKFKQSVDQIKQKFDAISNKIINGKLNHSFWRYFYASVVVDRRKVYFPEFQEKVERKRNQFKNQNY